MIAKFFNMQGSESEEHWVSTSDMMTGLMLIFLFLAISYILNVHQKTNKIIEQAEEAQTLLGNYKDLKDKLARDLQIEFRGDDTKKKQFDVDWKGYLHTDTLVIDFEHPFEVGSTIVPEGFKRTLTDFFPRYIDLLTERDYKTEIYGIRIEGHTSSEWKGEVSIDVAFMNNMALSQNRARNVLDYVLEIKDPRIFENKIWLKKTVTANGLSSSHLLLNTVKITLLKPTSLYSTIAEETKIGVSVVQSLHEYLIDEIPNWRRNQELDRPERIKIEGSGVIEISNDYFKGEIKPEAVERVTRLLLENKKASRRVAFQVVTKSEKVLEDMKQWVENFNQSTRRNENF